MALALLAGAPARGRSLGTPLPSAPRAEPDVVRLDAGEFVRGSSAEDALYALALCIRRTEIPGAAEACQRELFGEEMPARTVWLPAFGLDRTEVTHAAYDRCVHANLCAPPRTSDADPRVHGPRLPVTGVTHAEASRYCAFVGGRLPSEAEWERAARGRDLAGSRRFPWGRTYNDRLSNHGRGGGRPDGVDGFRYAAPVGSYPDGQSPEGLLDLAGNVWEWTDDRFEEGYYADGPRVDPRGPRSGGFRILRGGSWRSAPHTQRASHRLPFPEGRSAPDVGFRCAYDLAPGAM